MNQDFHLLQVQRFSDKSTSSGLVQLGKDAFLVFNKDGAQVLQPTYTMTTLGTGDGPHRQRAYKMTIVAPGEKNEMQMGYFIDEQDQSNDTPGWYGAPGWSKEADANYAKHKTDPVKPANFDDAVTLLMFPIGKMVDRQEAEQ